ncbi:MAG: hypothetical protein ACO3C1_12730 [Ilumatobacteraceae bacterium]
MTHDVAPSFDEKGYQAWLGNLRVSAPLGSLADLVEIVKAGDETFRDALRADKKAWNALADLVKVPA